MATEPNKSQFWEDVKSGRFASMVKESASGQALSNSLELYHVLKPLFAEVDDVETVYGIFLDAKNHILAIEKLFSGSISSASIYPREIVKKAIQYKASGFLIGHNHPSGNTDPSPEDQSITLRIGMAIASIDVAFHDHIIVGDGYHSMADSGWMRNVRERFQTLTSMNS